MVYQFPRSSPDLLLSFCFSHSSGALVCGVATLLLSLLVQAPTSYCRYGETLPFNNVLLASARNAGLQLVHCHLEASQKTVNPR